LNITVSVQGNIPPILNKNIVNTFKCYISTFYSISKGLSSSWRLCI